MTAVVIRLPGAGRPLDFDVLADPNLGKRFTSEDIHKVWNALEKVAIEEIRRLLQEHDPSIRSELSEKEYKNYVAQLAQFFLAGSADRITVLPYIPGSLFSSF